MSKELLIATTNRGKLRELGEMLSGLDVQLRLLTDFPFAAQPVEDGLTFIQNAVLKARHYSYATGLLTLSDDSGLEVGALGRAPGVLSARFGGHRATYAERMYMILEKLSNLRAEDRKARFICALALADPASGETYTFTGVCEGLIAEAPRGDGGFGYDPIFIPEGYTRTFGELPPEVKSQVSHRSRALQKAAGFLRSRFDTTA